MCNIAKRSDVIFMLPIKRMEVNLNSFSLKGVGQKYYKFLQSSYTQCLFVTLFLKDLWPASKFVVQVISIFISSELFVHLDYNFYALRNCFNHFDYFDIIFMFITIISKTLSFKELGFDLLAYFTNRWVVFIQIYKSFFSHDSLRKYLLWEEKN